MSGVYRTAQICKNGHVITSNTNYTAHLSNFCPECKAETISACPECNTPIRGQYDVPGVLVFQPIHHLNTAIIVDIHFLGLKAL